MDKLERISKTATFALSTQKERFTLSPEEYGKFVLDNYSELRFEPVLRDGFIKYQDSHNMEEVISKLTRGMDDISIEYVNHHERLVHLSRDQESILVKKDLLWTKEDQNILKIYQDKKAASSNSLINIVNEGWGQEIACKYALYDAEQFVPNIFSKINGKDIIDGGGYIGDTALLWRMLFSNSKVYTFEPMSVNFDKILALLKKDLEQGNAIAIKKALGKSSDIVKFLLPYSDLDKEGICPNGSATAKFAYEANVFEDVEVITIDSYVEEHNLDVGLIKLDVEGFAFDVVQGALNTIKTQHPVLVIGCYHSPEEFYEIKPLLEELNLNYHFEIRRSCINNPFCELCLMAYPL